MVSFLICLALLIGGYFVYGRWWKTPSGRTTARPPL